MPKLYLPEGELISTLKNRRALFSTVSLREAAAKGEILEARATSCDSEHNLIVDLGCMKGVIPRLEGAVGIAEGSTRDIALISRVGKPVAFTVDGFSHDEGGAEIALLSRRKAQLLCLEEYISRLLPGDIIPARVTHIESFGAFCDIGCGCIALMPIDTISVSRISSPRDRFLCGDGIKAVVKSIIDGKITLSMKELLGTWKENAAEFRQGETVSGIIRSVESYGVFVELTPNLAGLAEAREGVCVGQSAGVYIKSILPDKMKVKLIIIDAFDTDSPRTPIKYYLKEGHLDCWRYSPNGCLKTVQSVFE